MQWGVVKALETRHGGSWDPKNSGLGQANGKCMISLQNFSRVAGTLLGMNIQLVLD